MLTASKKIDYALLMMALLPEKGTEEYRSLKDIADEKHLSAGFLGQLMMPLKKSGLVSSREGAKGGYQLSRSSTDISLNDIYIALEGPLKLTSCLDINNSCICKKSCPTKNVWKDLQDIMNNYLSKKSLSEFRTQ